MKYNWKWSVLFEEPYLQWLVSGVQWTIMVAAAAWALAFCVGSVVGVARTLPFPWARRCAAAYVETFRNIPLLLQMFLWYFVLPEIMPDDAGRWMKRDMPNPEYVSAVACLGFYTASRIAEQVRAGIESVSAGVAAAARASGMRVAQVYRYVLLPVSYRIITPPLTSEFLTIFKNSSLALTIGLLELTAQSQQISEYTFHSFEAFTAATVIYVAISLLVTVGMRAAEQRLKIPGFTGGGRN